MKHLALAVAAVLAAGIGSAAAQDAYVVLTPENAQSYRLPDATTLDLLARARILDATGAELGSVVEVLGGQTQEIEAVVVALTTDPATLVVVPYSDLHPQIAGDGLVFSTSLAASEMQALPRWQ